MASKLSGVLKQVMSTGSKTVPIKPTPVQFTQQLPQSDFRANNIAPPPLPFQTATESTTNNIRVTPTGGGVSNMPVIQQGTQIPVYQQPATVDYSGMINQLAEAQKESQRQALERARQTALSGLGTEKTLAEQSQRDQVGQVRGTAARGARSFNEYLANKGLANSGSAAQGEISQNLALQGAETGIGQQTANALLGIEDKRTLAESNYATDLARSYADIEAAKAQGLIGNAQAQQARNDANASDVYNREMDKYKIGVDTERYNADQKRTDDQSAYERDVYEIDRQDRLNQQAIDNALNSKQITLQEAAARRAILESDRNYKLDAAQTKYNIGKSYYAPKRGGGGGETEAERKAREKKEQAVIKSGL